MEKGKYLKFNNKKIITYAESGNYRIKYFIYYSNKDDTDTDTDIIKCKRICSLVKSASCYAGLKSMIKSYISKYNKSPNRLRFLSNSKHHAVKEYHLSTDEIKKWVYLCKENGLMPSNIGRTFIEKEIYDISMDEVSEDLFYIYVIASRYVQEEPWFIRAILSLIEDSKLGFFTAIQIASQLTITNQGHHFIPISRSYHLMESNIDLNNKLISTLQSFKLNEVIGLYRLINDTLQRENIVKCAKTAGFSIHRNGREKVSSKPITVLRNELSSKTTEELIVS